MSDSRTVTLTMLIIQEMKSLARSGSVKLTKLIKPRVEQSESKSQEDALDNGDSDSPTILPILRVFHRERKMDKKEKEYEEKFNGKKI